MRKKTTTRDRLLRAAEEIVREEGALHMTMDAVAARAGVSKGGLIYHFPSQRALLEAMLQRHIAYFESRLAASRAKVPAGPTGEIRALIQTWFDMDAEFRQTGSALVAAVTREPDLMALIQRKHREILENLLSDRQTRDLSAVFVFAVEGIWFSELLGVQSYTDEERKRIRRGLTRLADEWVQARETSGTRSETQGRRRAGKERRKGKRHEKKD